jgi:hypothetical protein
VRKVWVEDKENGVGGWELNVKELLERCRKE